VVRSSSEVRLTVASCPPSGLRKGRYRSASACLPEPRYALHAVRWLAFLPSRSPRRLVELPSVKVSRLEGAGRSGWQMHRAGGVSIAEAGEGGGGGRGLGEGVMCGRASPAVASANGLDA
jgi:hypothetical protein